MFARTSYHYGVLFNEEPHNLDIDELIRGEMAAIDAYRQVEQDVFDEEEFKYLKKIESDHIKALNYWKDEARKHGNIPEKRKRLWGAFVQGVLILTQLVGVRAELKTLFRGELLGLKNYKKMLKSRMLSKEQKNKIKKVFLPQQQNHIRFFKQKYSFF
tara:strand:- start:838 stop:1311 length:474 start_codon:yes stop_codon:yes gene_type:complete